MGKHSRLFLILFASNFCCRFSFRDDALAVVDDVAAPRENNARGFDARSHHRRGGRIRRRHRGDSARRRSASFIANRDIIIVSSSLFFFFFFLLEEKKEKWEKNVDFFCVKFEKKK